MRNYLLNIDQLHLRIIRDVGRMADKKGLAVYLVGGVIRDILLKKKTLDLDFAVEGDALILARAMAKKWKVCATLHKYFGTASIQWSKHICIDLASSRTERYSRPGALPTVSKSSLNKDLFRRDFTVNTLAVAVNLECFGRLINDFNGLEDLKKKKIRVLHDQSFIDDPTRILRAVRFEQRLNFKIEPQTLRLIKRAVKKGASKSVKPSRYFAEFKKVFDEPEPIRIIKRLSGIGGLDFLGGKVPVSFAQLDQVHRVIKRFKKESVGQQFDDWWLVYYMGLISKFPDRVIEKSLKDFHFTKSEKKCIVFVRQYEELLKSLSAVSLRPSDVYILLDPLPLAVIIFLRAWTKNARAVKRIDRFLTFDQGVETAINGHDLRKIGITSGAQIGKVLKKTLYLKIDKKICTKQEEIKAAIAMQ